MKAGLMCALAKLRRKKVPNLFLGICIMLTAALLVNAFVLLKELTAIFDRAYEEMDGPQMCCLWSNEMIPPDIVRQYLDGCSEGFAYQITENTKTIDYIEKDGVKLSNGILLELPETMNSDMLSPKIPDGEVAKMPGKNEVWITKKMANILNLEIGDDIVLQLADKSVNVKVVKIVADPVFGGSSTNVYRMWCGYGELSDFPLAENNVISYLEIRFNEYSRQTEQDFIRDTEEYFKLPLGDTLYTYDRIKSGYTAPYQMVGAVLCFVSVVLSGTIIALTLFLVKSDIDEDIRNIGIYKSLGMSGVQIVGIYLACYGIIGFAGAVLGSVLGGWLNKGIITKILGDIGIYAVTFTGTGGYQLFAGIVVTAAVMIICFCAIFKVRRLNASRAIRGALPAKERGRKEAKSTHYNNRKFTAQIIRRASFELYYAVRGIQNKKLRYAYIAAVSMILGCLSVICMGCLNAVRNIDKEPEVWGFIKTDIYVTSLEDMPVSEIIAELESDSRINYTYGASKISSKYKPDNRETWQSIVTEVYELPWDDEVKDRSLYGRRPLKENEIGVGLALAKEYGLEIGEQIELVVHGEKKTYEITGIFQTLSNYGNIIRMVTNDLDQFVSADGAYGDYMLVLSNGTDKWEYAKELAEEYDGKFSFIASKSNGENITGILSPAVGTILTLLLIITILITMNLTFLLIRREQRLIGLLKAIGMASWQILKIYSWRNCLSALVGNSLGLLLGIFVIPDLLTPYARLLGLSEFPFANSLTGTAISFVLLPLCMFLSTCVIVRTINKISVKQLVSE